MDSRSAAEHDELRPGLQVGRYRLLQPLGAGGTSVVWSAEQPELGARVALKLLRPELAHDASAVRRFLREAQIINRVRSPHVVQLFDLVETEGRHFAVLELLEGQTLADCLHLRGPLSWADGQQVATQLARVVVTLHQAGVIHGDLKPENIFLTEGEPGLVKLIDFGLARVMQAAHDDAGREPRSGVVLLGTPTYCAPEQLEGKEPSPSADIYALGSVLYRMFKGAPPFSGSLRELVVAKVYSRRVPEELRAGGLPPEVVRVIARMLQPLPGLRPVAVEVHATLRARQARSAGELSRLLAPSAPLDVLADPSRSTLTDGPLTLSHAPLTTAATLTDLVLA